MRPIIRSWCVTARLRDRRQAGALPLEQGVGATMPPACTAANSADGGSLRKAWAPTVVVSLVPPTSHTCALTKENIIIAATAYLCRTQRC